jgi:uncharacterized repeat protein (TIGR01451 family)/CSLREA domain-containing protein
LVITVDSHADATIAGDNACTLREAITNANNDNDTTGGDCAPGSGDDVIHFAAALNGETITLSATLSISSNLTLAGPGAGQLAISGNNTCRVFDVASGVVEISGLTIQAGRVSSENGAGIRNAGALVIRNSNVVSNTIASGGTTEGGGVYNSGTLTITHSAIVSNTALGSNARGGGLASASGRVAVLNSTVSGNTANYWAGGLLNTGSSTMNVVNSTIVRNTATNFWGGGVLVESATTFKNTIIADNDDNSGARDCYYFGSSPVSQGYNVVQNAGNCTFGASDDLTGQDPNLGPLADNSDPATDWGQATWTHAPLPGSLAIDRILQGTNGCGTTITTDQRGYLRVGACDVGALEVQGIKVTLAKLVDDDVPDPGQTITYTLVVVLAQSGGVSITHALISDTLPDGVNFLGPVTLSGGSGGTTGTPPALVSGLTITGGMAVTVTFPVTVSTGLAGGTTITNTAAVSSSEVIVPVTASGVLTLTNVAPLAVADTPRVLEDSGATGLEVRANDVDLNDDNLTIVAVGPTGNGGTAIKDGGVIAYTPAENFNGSEVFTYTISDGSFTDATTVTVFITSVNDAPVIVQGETVSVTMSEEGAPVAFDLTLNANDVDGGVLGWDVAQEAAHGTAAINDTWGVTGTLGLSNTNAAIGYTPEADYYGSDSFVVQVSDGELTDTVTVRVTIEPVNEAPRATDDYGVMLWGSGENSLALDVLSNDVEPDGETLYIANVGTPSNGHVAISNLQSLLYTPTLTGTETFTYAVSDGSLADTATVNVTVVEGDKIAGRGETLLLPNTGRNNTITVTIEIPPGVASGNEHFALVYGASADPGEPPQGYRLAGLAFSLDAYVDTVPTSPFVFDTPITLTIVYGDADVAGIGRGEEGLELRYWDGDEWRSDSGNVTIVSRDTEQNRLVITIGHLTEFALIGQAEFEIYLPLVARGMS